MLVLCVGNDVCTLVTREPYGVCLAIAPWNAAMILSIRSIATPLAAGNTVILRSSEVVPHTHHLWGQLFADAGLPAGCLNIVHADRDRAPSITKQLIEDERVRHVNFVSLGDAPSSIRKQNQLSVCFRHGPDRKLRRWQAYRSHVGTEPQALYPRS
jgi:acyl-CoA reductase-like NAD-dependent aldehyde dehydrogenase